MVIYRWKSGYSAARGEKLKVYQHDSCETDGNYIEYLIRLNKEYI
jgi:hypothetical protein